MRAQRTSVAWLRTGRRPRRCCSTRSRGRGRGRRPCKFTLLIPDADARSPGDWTLDAALPELERAAGGPGRGARRRPASRSSRVYERCGRGGYDEVIVSTAARRRFSGAGSIRDLPGRIRAMGVSRSPSSRPTAAPRRPPRPTVQRLSARTSARQRRLGGRLARRRRFGVTSSPWSAPGGAGSPCSAARAPRFQSVLSTAVAVVAPWAATSSSTACSAQARSSTSSGESCSSSCSDSMRATSSGSTSSTPSSAQDVGDEVVGEQREAVEVAGGGDAGEGEVGGGDLGALEERHLRRRRRSRRRARSASSPAARRARRPSRRRCAPAPGRSRRARRATRSPSSRRWAREWPISSWPGSWPSRRRDLLAGDGRPAARPSTGRARAGRPRRCGSPTCPGGLRSVGNQPEPKLIAFSVSAEGGAVLGVRARRGRARAADSAGSVAAYGSIASSAMRTWRARAATRARRGADRRRCSATRLGAHDA